VRGSVKIEQDMLDYYAEGREQDRLSRGAGLLERLRTQELLSRWLPPSPSVILDVGGGAGWYAFDLASKGYDVHLLDPVRLHIEQALLGNSSADFPLVSTQVGDARELPFVDECADAVLLLGPLYHLVSGEDRALALREACRVLRPGGVAVVAAISRWATTADGLVAGKLRIPGFDHVILDHIHYGLHAGERIRGWLTTAYCHRPEELTAEIARANMSVTGPIVVEGLGWLAPDVESLLQEPELRARVLDAIRRTEDEPALIGASAHMLAVGRKRVN
jgi:SAM-dependent methyltransferase